MSLGSGVLIILFLIVVIAATSGTEQGVILGGGEAGSGFGPFNSSVPKEELPYEANWVITDQPRCCSDCTFVAAGFKCKVKSCLHNCPWARSAAPERAVPVF